MTQLALSIKYMRKTFQIMDEEIPQTAMVDDTDLPSVAPKRILPKRRRTYEPKGLSIPPYRTKPSLISSDFLPLNHQFRKNIPVSLEKAREADLL